MNPNNSVFNTINKYQMIETDDKIMVLISGGPDSVMLTHFLSQHQIELSVSILLFHINHKLRGRHSDNDELFVKEFGAQLGLKVVTEAVDTLEYCNQNKLSLEDGARNIRYEKAFKVAKDLEITKIATAHTADDNAETFIMRAMRGAGLLGLSGIPPVRSKIIRPLIGTFRKDVLDYCASNNVDYIVDLTNMEPTFFRNKIRLEVVPKLDELFPAWKANISKTMEILRQDMVFLTNLANDELEKTLTKRTNRLIVMDLSRFNGLDLSLKRIMLRSALDILAGHLKQIEFKHIEFIIKRSLRSGNFMVNLPAGIIVLREYDKLIIKFSEDNQFVTKRKLPFNMETYLPEAGIEIKVEEGLPRGLAPDKPIAQLDAAKVTGNIYVRGVEHGDRFIPLGMKGSKKVFDYMSDKKIPKRIRDRALVVTDDSKILWLVGFEISELAKIGKNTKKVITLRSEYIES